jgi:hypothetical protein
MTHHALSKVMHEHHDVLIPHVDALAAIADAVGTVPPDELADRIGTEHRFITTQLVPHMEQVEATLYPELRRLFQNRHAMTPMRLEHGVLLSLIGELGDLRTRSGEFGAQLRIRRVLYRLYALLKTHLAEEEAYIGVLQANLSPEEADDLARGMAHASAVPL